MYILASLGTIVEKLFRNIFFLIDDVIFSFIPRLYNLLTAIARTSPISQATIADMASRVYRLLAVFMIFKVTLSLIMYIVNPDDFSDKSKGVSKLVTNIVISLALLILTPYIFSYAYQFQKIILEDNAMATLIFGEETDSSHFNIIDAGDQMAYLAISPFVTPNTNQFQNCTTLAFEGANGEVILNKDCFGFENADLFAENYEKCSDTGNGKLLCGEAWRKSAESDFTRSDLANYAAGIQYSNYNLFFRKSVVTSKLYIDGNDNFFAFNYSFILSTVVGVIIVLFLITTCMDIALRSIKLAFLQLIAPIPILSYVDPKSGKDGMFKKWYQMCLKTYALLFIKLLVIYFAIYIISRVGKLVDIIDGSYITNGYVKIFIIIGALMFAKNFTKILEGLGIKLDGGFQLNPFKKLEDEALGMKKPAAFANKLTKGILTSPISGAQTFGKKMIGGVDAAINGKGFRQGWNRTHGNLHNKFYKKLDEWAPDSAEARKQERQGKEEVKYMNTKWTQGAKKAEKLRPFAERAGKSDVFAVLDGANTAAYSAVYKSNAFIASRMNLDKADEKRKALTRISEATARGVSLSEAIQSEIVKDPTGRILDLGKMNAIKATNDMNAFIKMRDDNSKAVAGLEKVHESIRKQYQDDAATEDQLKFVKYNEIDPTNPTNPNRHFNKAVSSSGTSTTGTSTTGTSTSGSGTAGTPSAGSGTAGTPSAGSGTAGTPSAGSGTTGTPTAGSGTAGAPSTEGSTTADTVTDDFDDVDSDFSSLIDELNSSINGTISGAVDDTSTATTSGEDRDEIVAQIRALEQEIRGLDTNDYENWDKIEEINKEIQRLKDKL